jgi:hypothetical protein
MSKRTNKRKIRSKKKANHGKRPNCGRGSPGADGLG